MFTLGLFTFILGLIKFIRIVYVYIYIFNICVTIVMMLIKEPNYKHERSYHKQTNMT